MATVSPSERAALLLRRSTADAAADAEAVVGRRHCSQHVKPVQHYTSYTAMGRSVNLRLRGSEGVVLRCEGKRLHVRERLRFLHLGEIHT